MENWRKYEETILEKLKPLFSSWTFEYDKKIIGKLSGRSRQVDIFLSKTINNKTYQIAIDCKFYSKRINIKHVESFIGMMKDLNTNQGILITNVGYTKSAEIRVFNDEVNLELDIYNFALLKDVQTDVIAKFYPHLQYSLTVLPPFGFVVDQRKGSPFPYICFFVLRGLSVEEAMHDRNEMLDISLFPKMPQLKNAGMFKQIDIDDCKTRYDSLLITDFQFEHNSATLNTGYRIELSDTIIYKLLIEFDKVILAFNLYCNKIWESKNLRKLLYIVNIFVFEPITQIELKNLEVFYGKLDPRASYNMMLTFENDDPATNNI